MWSEKELRELSTMVFLKLVEGKNDDEIAEEMNISVKEVVKVKKRLYEDKAAEIKGKPVEHVYIEYLIAQSRNIEDLTTLITDNKNVSAKGLSAVVGAIRTRAEIHDKILVKGQECGLVKKVPNRTENVFGVFVEDLTNKELREYIVKQAGSLGSLVDKFGEQNILELPPPTVLHEGPKLEESLLETDENTIDLNEGDYKVEEKKKPMRTKIKRMKAHFAMED
jgi:hypothetical protein